ncbi:MAG: oligosaccharide flippase family protein [Candidatus Micrarchaeaceae archaeon]
MPKKPESSVESLSFIYIANLINVAINLSAIVIISNILGPQKYATFILYFSFFSIIDIAGNFGLGSYISKKMGEGKGDEKTYGATLELGLMIGAITTLLGISLSYFVSQIYSEKGANMAYFMLASLITTPAILYGTAYHALIGAKKAKYASISSIIQDLAYLSLSVGLINELGPASPIFGLLLSYIIGFAIEESALKMKPKKGDIKEAVNFSYPIAISNAMNALTNYSPLFLAFFVGSAQLGNYGLAIRGFSVIAVIYGSIKQILVPYSAFKKGYERDQRAFAYSIALSVPLILFLGIFSKSLVNILTPRYHLTPQYLFLISIGTAIGVFGNIGSAFATGYGDTKAILKYTSISFFIQLALMLALTPYFNVYGTIVSLFFAGSFTYSLLILRYLNRKAMFSYSYMPNMIASFLIMGLIMYLISFIRGDFLSLLLGVISLFLYPLLLYFTKSISKEDFIIIKREFNSIGDLGRAVGKVIDLYIKMMD